MASIAWVHSDESDAPVSSHKVSSGTLAASPSNAFTEITLVRCIFYFNRINGSIIGRATFSPVVTGSGGKATIIEILVPTRARRSMIDVDILGHLFRALIPSAWRSSSFILLQKMQKEGMIKGITIENESSLNELKKGESGFKKRKRGKKREGKKQKSWAQIF